MVVDDGGTLNGNFTSYEGGFNVARSRPFLNLESAVWAQNVRSSFGLIKV